MQALLKWILFIKKKSLILNCLFNNFNMQHLTYLEYFFSQVFLD